MSKRPNEIKEDNFDPGPAIQSNRLTRFLGNDQFQVLEWVDWREDLFAVPIRLFFNWKRIDRHEDYFNIDFARVLTPKTDDYFRLARCHGLEAQDFAKVVVTVAQFVYRAADSYPSNDLHCERQTESKADPQNITFCHVPFGEIFAVLGTNAKDPDLELLLKGTAVGWKGDA